MTRRRRARRRSCAPRPTLLLLAGAVLLLPGPRSVATADAVPVTADAVPVTGDGTQGPPRTSLAPSVAVLDASAAEQRLLDGALTRFRDAGMRLPDLRVTFHDDEAPCHGHLGWFSARTRPWSVHVCSDLPFVVTHELAHAWIDAHVGRAEEQAILDATGLEHWRGEDVPWQERGVERTAFVIQQVLTSPGGRRSPAWEERLALFELATDLPVPRADRWSDGR